MNFDAASPVPSMPFRQKTSALDAQSEKMVQEALDRIMSGRTTIAVAHRLNTIKNLDSIAVLGEGKVVELGTYPQLMNTRSMHHMFRYKYISQRVFFWVRNLS